MRPEQARLLLRKFTVAHHWSKTTPAKWAVTERSLIITKRRFLRSRRLNTHYVQSYIWLSNLLF